MYVIISLKIDLEATAPLSQLENQIEEAGRAAMKAALKQAIQQNEQQHHRCPRCGSDQVHTKANKAPSVADSFWAGGCAAQAVALPRLSPVVSPKRRAVSLR